MIVLALAFIVGGAWIGKQVYDSAQSARGHLLTAMTRAAEAKSAIMTADIDAAHAAIVQAQEETKAAVADTDSTAWSIAETIPFGPGENVRAVRVVAELTNRLVSDLEPSVAALDISALTPRDGGFDLAMLDSLHVTVASLKGALDSISKELLTINREVLIGQVDDGVDAFSTQVQELRSFVDPVEGTLALLPRALGSDGPRNYLLMFQGNSEARSLGGNPAVYLVLRAEAGAIRIVQYADTAEFPNGLDKPITALSDEELNIYGDKIGRWTPDLTMVPDFPRATEILRAHWDAKFDTPIDGVISVDPIALSYLLAATGPVTTPTGETLSAENVVAMLLNQVYFIYPDGYSQNAFFAGATQVIFEAITGGGADPLAFVDALAKAAGEGRILYSSSDEAETETISDTRLSGRMPTTNDQQTTLGVFVNDNTGSKKSFYLDLTVTGAIDTCEAVVRGTATLSSWLTAERAATLPYYIRGPHFAAEDISSYVTIYGPVGSKLTKITLDDATVTPLSEGEHLGRPAVKIEVMNVLDSSHTLAFEFSVSDESADDLGPLSVWNTPMSRATDVKVESAPVCQ